MGATPRRIRRLHIPAALALVLVLAGSTNPVGGHHHEQAALAAAPASDAPSEASVTVVDPQRYPATVPAEALPPAVHIAAAGPQVDAPVRVDIADVLLEAYRHAAGSVPAACHLPVSLLAAIGQVESGSLVGRPLDAQHRTSVLGPVLDGTGGFAAIPDTDGGRWDGNAQWDRAMGLMQFIPSTWARFGVDADGDGVANPQDVEDASAAAAGYLCYGGRDLSRPADLRSAILSYNHSSAYLRLVLTYQQRFASLGLDNGRAVSGLPTTLSLVATPVAGTDGWSSSLAKAAAATAPAVHTTKPAKAGKKVGHTKAATSKPTAPATSGPPAGNGGGQTDPSKDSGGSSSTGGDTTGTTTSGGSGGTGTGGTDSSQCPPPAEGSTTTAPNATTTTPADPGTDPSCDPCATTDTTANQPGDGPTDAATDAPAGPTCPPAGATTSPASTEPSGSPTPTP